MQLRFRNYLVDRFILKIVVESIIVNVHVVRKVNLLEEFVSS